MFKLEKTLKFVNVDLKYLKKLHDVSSEVYYKESNYETKPYLGILLTTEGRKYVLPLASAKEKHKFWKNADVDRFLIYEMVDKRGLGKNDVYVEQKDTDEVKHILSAIDLKKMIPVVDSVISYVDINVHDTDSEDVKKYKALLNKEYGYCLKIMDDVVSKAGKIYDKQKSTGKISKFCCDFTAMEKVADDEQNAE